jgi:hypothetical protein
VVPRSSPQKTLTTTAPEKGKNVAKNLKVLFVVSEAVPYAKTGGLADVARTLRS